MDSGDTRGVKVDRIRVYCASGKGGSRFSNIYKKQRRITASRFHITMRLGGKQQ